MESPRLGGRCRRIYQSRTARALREVEFKKITPLTVLLGPNGSGKSTVFDVFAFLAECFELGLRRAWDKRGRAKEFKTRNTQGPVIIEIKYRELGYPLITYHLAVDERDRAPMVVEEWLRWRPGRYGRPFPFLDYRDGKGQAISGDLPGNQAQRVDISGQDDARRKQRGPWPPILTRRVTVPTALRNFAAPSSRQHLVSSKTC